MANVTNVSKKLMMALNARGYKLTFSTKQFIGTEGNVHNYYSINKAVWSEEKHKYLNNELYSSTSMIRIALYLRDMWYRENGWPLPKDNEVWNQIRWDLQDRERNREEG